jgi:hypothetical protein
LIMQLRKVVNHPFMMPDSEPRGDGTSTLQELLDASGVCTVVYCAALCVLGFVYCTLCTVLVCGALCTLPCAHPFMLPDSEPRGDGTSTRQELLDASGQCTVLTGLQ